MSTIDFDQAVEYVLSREGGLSENPKDSGGTTNFGISLRFLKSIENVKKYGVFGDILEEDDIRHLTRDQAKALYKGEFWDHAPFEKLHSQNIANYLFDAAVNMGIAPAIKCAQRSCWAILKKKNVVVDDGILGNQTIDSINHCGFYLLPVLRAERAAYYRSIVASNPDQKVFLEGWLNRAYNEVV